jgi:hypothetical protein
MNRRELMLFAVAGLTTRMAWPAHADEKYPVRLVFVHGRSQQGKDSDQLRATWIKTLHDGAQKLGRTLPDKLDVAFPFYGNTLDDFARRLEIPLTADIRAKGATPNDEFLLFEAEIAEAMRQRAGVTDAQVDQEYGPNPKEKGPLNWEWVHAILRALDKHGGGLSQSAIESFMRDVFLYTTRLGVRDEIDRIVGTALSEQPTVVVGHSLGSVVAYNVLRSDRRALHIRALVTVGSPLGIRAIRDQLRPLRFPAPAAAWYNAFDVRDVVALFPLDAANFPVTPAIENYGKVNNHTDNRHGIVGYLDDADVAKHILNALAV